MKAGRSAVTDRPAEPTKPTRDKATGVGVSSQYHLAGKGCQLSRK